MAVAGWPRKTGEADCGGLCRFLCGSIVIIAFSSAALEASLVRPIYCTIRATILTGVIPPRNLWLLDPSAESAK